MAWYQCGYVNEAEKTKIENDSKRKPEEKKQRRSNINEMK